SSLPVQSINVSPDRTLCYSFISSIIAPPTTDIYTLSLHDALPIWQHRIVAQCVNGLSCPRYLDSGGADRQRGRACAGCVLPGQRSEEHTSELQSREKLVCRLLLEKKQEF